MFISPGMAFIHFINMYCAALHRSLARQAVLYYCAAVSLSAVV